MGAIERKDQPNATDGLFVPQRLVICLSFRSHESLPPSHPRVIEDCGPRGLTLGGKEFTDRREKWRETLTRRMDANAQQESIRLTSLSLPLVGNCLSFPRSGGHSCRLVVCLAPVSCVRCPDRGRETVKDQDSPERCLPASGSGPGGQGQAETCVVGRLWHPPGLEARHTFPNSLRSCTILPASRRTSIYDHPLGQTPHAGSTFVPIFASVWWSQGWRLMLRMVLPGGACRPGRSRVVSKLQQRRSGPKPWARVLDWTRQSRH